MTNRGNNSSYAKNIKISQWIKLNKILRLPFICLQLNKECIKHSLAMSKCNLIKVLEEVMLIDNPFNFHQTLFMVY